jgi:drug/metabolite transporter (DMT)-like permease
VNRSEQLKGYVLVLMSAILCGTIGIFGKKVMDLGAKPLEMVAWRALFSFALISGIALFVKRSLFRIRLRDLPFFILFGAVGIGANFFCYFYAIELKVPVAVVSVLLYTYPFMIAALAAVLLGERFTAVKAAALVLSFVGCLLVVNIFNTGGVEVDWRGILFGLGNAAGVAVFTLMSKKAEKRYGPWTVLIYSLGFGAATLFLVLRPNEVMLLRLPFEATLWLVALAAVSTIAGYSLFLFGLRYLQASKASIVATVEVVVAAILAYRIFHEKLHWLQILGAALVILAVIVIQKRERVHADVAEH